MSLWHCYSGYLCNQSQELACSPISDDPVDTITLLLTFTAKPYANLDTVFVQQCRWTVLQSYTTLSFTYGFAVIENTRCTTLISISLYNLKESDSADSIPSTKKKIMSHNV